MNHNLKNFICLFILLTLSFSVFGVEISSDLFISEKESFEKENTEVSELENTTDWKEPVVNRVYTKEKVIIKRDTSALDEEVEDLESREIRENVTDTSLDTEFQRRPSSSSEIPDQSVDYGDYEIHWTKRNK